MRPIDTIKFRAFSLKAKGVHFLGEEISRLAISLTANASIGYFYAQLLQVLIRGIIQV
jgi:hypothetical protein